MDKTRAIVLRTSDWSETSRIATLWTRDFGKVRALAKGGKRLRSSFESALDLLTVCDIVLLRKSSGSLDLLTEAQVVQRFRALHQDLSALYAGYYVAELLSDWTQEADPHPVLFEEVLVTLENLGKTPELVGLIVMRFEVVFLREMGYMPSLTCCAGCQAQLSASHLAFSPSAGGILCSSCQKWFRDHRPLSVEAQHLLLSLADTQDSCRPWPSSVRSEVRQHLGGYVTTLRGRPPRLLPYLGS